MKSYQPSSGTEGMCFFARWCDRCARDAYMNGTVRDHDDLTPENTCEIIGLSMAHSPGDPEYPKEWVVDDYGEPRCTAFVPFGEDVPLPRCDKTLDLFADAG